MKTLDLKRGYKCSKNYEIAFKILSLDQFYTVILLNKSIYARHRMYPAAFFFSWPIKLVKEWIDCGWFYATRRRDK